MSVFAEQVEIAGVTLELVSESPPKYQTQTSAGRGDRYVELKFDGETNRWRARFVGHKLRLESCRAVDAREAIDDLEQDISKAARDLNWLRPAQVREEGSER